MRIQSPSLPELHAFVSISRLGSLARAAQALEVTPGAVSRAVARLQEQFGQALLVRQGRGVALTAQGQAYFEAIAPALDALEDAALQAKVPLESNELRLSITPTLASHWLIPRLPDFHRQHPQISLAFMPYRRGEYPLVASQGASLRGSDGQWPAGVEADYVVGRQIVAVCRPEDLQRLGELSSPRDLLQLPLLFHANYPNTWANWLAWLGCPTQGLVAAARFEQVSQLLEAAVAGMGIALVQRCLADQYLAAGKLVIAYPQCVSNDRGYFLCYPQALRRSPALVAFRGWVMAQGQAYEQQSSALKPKP